MKISVNETEVAVNNIGSGEVKGYDPLLGDKKIMKRTKEKKSLRSIINNPDLKEK